MQHIRIWAFDTGNIIESHRTENATERKLLQNKDVFPCEISLSETPEFNAEFAVRICLVTGVNEEHVTKREPAGSSGLARDGGLATGV